MALSLSYFIISTVIAYTFLWKFANKVAEFDASKNARDFFFFVKL